MSAAILSTRQAALITGDLSKKEDLDCPCLPRFSTSNCHNLPSGCGLVKEVRGNLAPMRLCQVLLTSHTLREPAQSENPCNILEKDMPRHTLAPPNGFPEGPAFPTKHPPFSHQAWEIRLTGIQRKWKTTQQPEILDWTKPAAYCPQQGGVLEKTTFVKPGREDNTEPGMGNEICMYLGPHPALSSHRTSCLCIQGALDPIQKRRRGTNVVLTTPLRAGRNKEDPPG